MFNFFEILYLVIKTELLSLMVSNSVSPLGGHIILFLRSFTYKDNTSKDQREKSGISVVVLTNTSLSGAPIFFFTNSTET